ncbi:MAG: hypothetical protein KF729_33360 [Sandaracinaceae bacterium]|nr:hypothetical protein [Sandaracinaceae bacterium]
MSEPPRTPSLPPAGGAADGVKLMLAALALGALALGGWVVFDLVRDRPVASDDEALPPLPEPGEPVTRAMVATGGGYGWTWVNPLPRWMPTWYAVSVADEGARAVMVGHRGAAVRYEDGAIVRWEAGTAASLRGVAWIGPREAIAVGDDGAIVRLGADGARALAGATGTLRGVVATGPGRALAVGDDGAIVRIDADGVSTVASELRAHLLGVYARGERVFIVGDGTILRLEGERIEREPSPVTSILRAVGGCPRGGIYAVGDEGVILWRRGDATWRRVATHTRQPFLSVSCDHGRVAAVAADGRVLLASGDRTVALPSGFDHAWYAVAGGERGPSWLAGAGGRLATIEDDHVRTRTDGPAVPIRALGAIGGAMVAVGEWGRILRQTEAGLVEASSPTESGLAALLRIDASRLLAVGDFGALVDIRHDRATLLGTPTQASLRDAVGGADGVIVVGGGGTILRGLPEALVASAVEGAGDLWAIDGAPSSAIAVGEDALVLRLNERGFSRVSCDARGATLRDVARLTEGTFAVGDAGTIVRIEGSECALERSGGPTLHAIGRGPAGRPIAAGDDGVVLERSEAGEWSRVGVDVLGASLRTIWRSDRHVYVAGAGGVIVRHVIVDGT